MELEIRRRESTGSGPNTYVETETLAKFELMDGAPVRGIYAVTQHHSFLHGPYKCSLIPIQFIFIGSTWLTEVHVKAVFFYVFFC